MNGEQPHFPGERTVPQFSHYTDWQAKAWQAMDDNYYARIGGYDGCRMATPGAYFDNDEFEKWVEKMEASYEFEHKRNPGTRAMTRKDFSPTQLLAFYERLKAAGQMRKPGQYNQGKEYVARTEFLEGLRQ